MLLLATLLIYILVLIAFPSNYCYVAIVVLNLIHLYSFIKQSPREYIEEKTNKLFDYWKSNRNERSTLTDEDFDLITKTIEDKHGILYYVFLSVNWIPFIIKVTTIIGLLTYSLFKLYNLF